MPYPIRAEWFDRPGWSGFHTPRPGNSDGLHHGFDYYCPEGTPIYAAADGVVKGRGSGFGPTSFGNNTTIWYDGTPIATATYAHMNALPLNPVGTRVTANTILGYVGHTGNAAAVIWNGLRHVHEEILINGRYVDPIKYHGPVAVAVADSKPITPETIGAPDVVAIIQITNVVPNPMYVVGQEFIVHLTTEQQAIDAAKVFGLTIQKIDSNDELVRVLAALAIPQGQVKHLAPNPVTKQPWPTGHTWSRVGDAVVAAGGKANL